MADPSPGASPEDMSAQGMSSVAEVGRVVAGLNLVTAFGHVSRRTSATTYDITILGDLATLGPDQSVSVDLNSPTLPAAAPGESWLHTEIYRARPDAGGIVRAQPESTFAAAAVTNLLKPLHGQAAWLGSAIPVFPTPRLIRSRELGIAAASAMATSSALLLRANGAVTIGVDPAIAAARMWLLSTACDVWLRAHAAGQPIELSEQDVEVWDSASPPLLERLWHTMVRTAGVRPSPPL